MKSRITTIIMTIVILLIVSVFALFGVIFWNELKRLETSAQPENVKTIISGNANTINQDIQTPQILGNPFNDLKDGDKQANEVDYSHVTINKYFYNQLD